MTTKDNSVRENAVTATGRNIAVEAGAGTGKTTLLINRLCFLIAARGVAAERIVALTFTEKAAAEIKLRLALTLQKILDEIDAPETQNATVLMLLKHAEKEEIISRCRAALEKLDRSFISTIHSFCSYILKSYPVEAGLSPSAVVDEGEQRARLFNRAWHIWLEEELTANSPSEKSWEEVLKQISLEEIYDYAFEICSGKVESYHPFSHAKLISEVCFENAAMAEQMSTAFLQGPKSRKIERSLASAAVVLQESGFAFKEKKFAPSDNPEPETLTSADQAKGWDDDNFETAAKIVEFARSVHTGRQVLIGKVYDLVKNFTQNVRESYAAQGLLSFDDLLVKTRNLLKENIKVRSLLKEQFEIILIDEFQDTDPVQGELLLFLSEEKNGAADDWKNIKLATGKLFVVGDPKQSIYRFRGADITAYQLFTEMILKQGGQQCFLQTNFRSAGGIIDFVNAVGGGIIKEKTGFQPSYVPILVSDKNAALPKSVEEIIIKSPDKQTAAAYRHNQAEYIAKWISENIGVLELADGRLLDYKDIAILMRTSNSFNIFTDALKRHGVKYTVEEDKNFYTAQEIIDFINLLALLETPSDKNALAGVLRSPLGGFTDGKIYKIFKAGAVDIFARRAAPGFERVTEFYKMLAGLASLAGRVTLGELIHKILSETLFIELTQRAYNGEQTVSNINKFAAAVAAETAQNPLSLGQFLLDLKEIRSSGRGEGESPLADEMQSAVSVMTIHKSKGLEFPIVFLADIFRLETHKSNAHGYSWFHNMHGLRAGGFADANLAFLEIQSLWHGRSEEARVLYVALTRAKEKLFISGQDEEPRKTAARHLINCGVWPEAGCEEINLKLPVEVTYQNFTPPEDFIYASRAASTSEQKIDEKWPEIWAAREKKYLEIKEAQVFISPSSLAEHDAPRSGGSEDALALGELCHKMLELWDFKTDISPADITAVAATLEIAPPENVIKEAQNIFAQFNGSQAFKMLTAAEVIAKEMPFTFLDGGKIINGVMDLVIKRGGDIFVFDYKTDKKLDIKIYKPQLDAYARAAREIFKTKRVKSGIISLIKGEECLIN
ncbi:MAG: UvrD-helicase domain-containing protein [Elusimicrobia bacterium]|nr:UvrD-helicase domain-containing protein [Elusimicrobiota bacterium]